MALAVRATTTSNTPVPILDAHAALGAFRLSRRWAARAAPRTPTLAPRQGACAHACVLWPVASPGQKPFPPSPAGRQPPEEPVHVRRLQVSPRPQPPPAAHAPLAANRSGPAQGGQAATSPAPPTGHPPPTNCKNRVILAQLEGSGRGALGAYTSAAYTTLSQQLLGGGAAEISRDPDAFVAALLEKVCARACACARACLFVVEQPVGLLDQGPALLWGWLRHLH